MARTAAARPHVTSSCPCTGKHEDAYRQWPRLDEIFQQHVSGVQTKCDALFVGFTREEVEQRMRDFLADAARGRFAADLPAWLPRKTAGVSFDAQQIRPYMVAPWDVRWIYYEPRLLGRARSGVLRHLDGRQRGAGLHAADDQPGPATIISWPRPPWSPIACSTTRTALRSWLRCSRVPQGKRVTNFQRSFLQNWQPVWGTVGTTRQRVRTSFGSSDVFHWIYAAGAQLAVSPRYQPHAVPRFPAHSLADRCGPFRDLARLGKELVEIHCRVAADPLHRRRGPMPGLPQSPWRPAIRGGRRPRRCSWIAGSTWPEPIEEAVWQFRIGGYAVLPRWLKQRQRRMLYRDDQQHLQRMIQAIRATLVRTRAIDQIE